MNFILARIVLPLLVLANSVSAASHRSHRVHKTRRHAHRAHEKRRVASFARMQHENEKLLAVTMAAEAELSDTTHQLEEMLLDVMSNATQSNATSSTLRGTSKAVNSTSKFSANVTANLKFQQNKLDALFKHLKLNIASFNKREADQKKDGQEYAERLKVRLEKDKKRLQDASLSAFDHEMLVNRTRMEESELKFWTHGRELQHDMFHSNLKLTHGLMSRVKTVMEAYKEMLTNGKVDPNLTKSLKDSLPKAFIQRETRIKRDVRRLGKHLKRSAQLLEHH